MSDPASLRERLEDILKLLKRASSRFGHVASVEDFQRTDEGLERLDALCMVFIATGEAVRRLDRETTGTLFARYPEVPWASVKGIRDVIAHGYFDVDAEQIFNICKSDLPLLIGTLERMIAETDPSHGS